MTVGFDTGRMLISFYELKHVPKSQLARLIHCFFVGGCVKSHNERRFAVGGRVRSHYER